MFRFKCDGQELRCVMYDEAASGFIDTVFAEFDLCKRWADMVVTVQYTQMQNGVEKTFNESLDSETGIAKVSNSLIDGPVDVSIFGYVPETGARLTTDPVRIRINRSGFKDDGAPSVPPSPDLYAKLLHEVDEIVKKGISDRQIADAVNAHLDANPVQVVTDETLEKPGMPADAAAVGAALKEFDNSKDNNSNLANGEAEGSLRSVGSDAETDEYKLGKYAVAVGHKTKASGEASFAEGRSTEASGAGAHVEGISSKASGIRSHAENGGTQANGDDSHSEGLLTKADGRAAHAEGCNTVATGEYQHVQGKYNVEDTENRYAHIVGNGGVDREAGGIVRSNAHTLDWDGNAWYPGDVYVGGTSQDDADRLAKEKEIRPAIENVLAETKKIEVVRLVSFELSHTRQEIIDAAEAGKTIIGTDGNGVVYVYTGMEESNIDQKTSVPTFCALTSSYDSNGNSVQRYIQFKPDGESIITGQKRVSAKNPRPLVFSGAVNATYYGHETVNITIPKGGEGGGGTAFETDESLTLKDGILSVNTADVVEEDNTLPVTSAAVFTEVGNINALLATI